MIPLDLTKAERKALNATLKTSHEVRVTVNMLNLAGKVLGTARITDGQVLGDRRKFGQAHGPTKRLTLVAFDPRNALGVDSGDPSEGIMYADRQIEVIYSVRVPLVGWVDVPVFLGTPTSWNRTADEVQVSADDSIVLGMGAAWAPMSIPKGTKKTDAIERILSRRTGMTRFDFPKVKARLPKPFSLHRMTRPVGAADRIAKSMDMQLFRRANGRVVLRRYNHNVRWVFDTDIVEPVATTQSDEITNTVLVLGRNPKGPKKRIRAVAQAPRKHPLSAWRINEETPDGTQHPRRIVHRIENDKIRSKKEAKRKAERVLRDRLRSTSEVTVGVLPNPLLEVGDWLAARSDEGPVEFRLDTYSLPLSVAKAEPMTLGFFLNAPVNKRRIRR